MKKISLITILIVLSGHLFSQTHEMGVTGGMSFYMGDLNPSTPFKKNYPAVGLIYRRNLNHHFVIRVTGMYGKVSADDAKASNGFQKTRNLRFESKIAELAAGFEFNFFGYEPGNNKKMFFTPYIFAGVGGFYFSPQAYYNGSLINLRDLGTEGQGIIPGKKRYSNFQACVPFGIGIKYNPFKGCTISAEWGMRMTFTDYIDDVSGRYVAGSELAAAGKPTVDMADQSIGVQGDNAGRQRGLQSTRDWYSYAGLYVCFRIKDPKGTCWPLRGNYYRKHHRYRKR